MSNDGESCPYPCCMCKYFDYEKGTWGFCTKINVSVKGNLKSCQIAVPFFDKKEQK